MEDLKKFCNQLNINSNVDFLGFKKNPHKYVRNSDIYVMSSNREGFPNSLVEAMFTNGYVISTDCETGPNEIITDNVDGFLVPLNNPEIFSERIVKLLNDEDIRKKFYDNSREKIRSFDVQKMIKQFNDLVHEV